MARAQGAREGLAVAFETVYGTSPTTGYRKLPFVSNALGESQDLLENELLGFGRDPLAPDIDSPNVAGDIVVPIDAEAFGVWLKATFGQPVTTGAGPYTHTFTTGGWTLPSLSVEKQNPEVPHFGMSAGVRLNQMNFAMQRSGFLTATLGLMGQSETLDVETGAGSPTAYDLIRFVQRHGSISRNGSPMGNVVSSELTYSNNLDMVEVVGNGGLIAGLDPSIASMRGTFVIRFDNQALLTQAINGSSCALVYGMSRPTGESLTVTLPRVFLPRPRIETSGPAGVQATFDWQASQQANGAAMATIVLVNEVETY